MNELDRLHALGLKLPEPSEPGGNYQSVNIRNKVAHVAIQFPILNGEFLHLGRLGEQVNTEQGKEAMQICALNVLSQMESKVGFDNILGLNHLEVHYRSTNSWDESPQVVDAASNLFAEVLGDKGLHSRSIFGVENLPRHFCLGLTTSFTLK